MTPDEVVEADRTTFPGGCMAGYIVWNSRHISAYLTETKLDRNNLILFPDQYTEWLARRYARGQLALALEAS
ncbi:hypothetical protein LMG27174_05766 [Paraburkholderia rhynchosiae]|nr:hypothetical protein LMG27174_05766 [Paraburkholderia rhynchosiae]